MQPRESRAWSQQRTHGVSWSAHLSQREWPCNLFSQLGDAILTPVPENSGHHLIQKENRNFIIFLQKGENSDNNINQIMSLLDSKPFKKSKWSSPYLDLQDPTWSVATIPSTDAWTLKLIFCFFFSDFLYHYLERPLVCQTQQAYSYLKAFTSFFHLTSRLFFF